MDIATRIKNSWNAFLNNRDPTGPVYNDYSRGSTYKPDRPRLSRGNERTIVTSVLNRIALDVASITINHCRLDENKRFTEVIESDLNNCLTLEPNLDQTSRAFIQDVVMSMLDEGCVAIVPTDTKGDPTMSKSYDILSLRVGKIVGWYPSSVRVNVYNERTGRKEDIVLPKRMVAIVENPLYAIMNEPNSTLQRLVRKLALLDSVDEQSSSGKLDLIVQLPYVIKSETRRKQANERREEVEKQLKGSKYGIAYIDGTEKITQLNRPVENNLMKQVEYLTNMLFSQLGITQAIMDGTADEVTMLNYYSRTVEPILASIVDEMIRKFLTKTARSQNQTIKYFRDPFKLVPVKDLAELSDKFTRNEIASSNEFRQVIGWKPSDDPRADMLLNSNLNHPEETLANKTPVNGDSDNDEKDEEDKNIKKGESQNGV